jgi:DDE superfamily endonuclease
MLRYQDIAGHETQLLDLTSLSGEAFRSLITPFEQAFQEHMQQWTMTGQARKERSFSIYANCPLPTPEDRLLFTLSYLKHAPRQSYHGVTFGLIQSSVSTWLNILIPVLQTALRSADLAPSRTLDELRERIGVAEGSQMAGSPFFTMAPSDPSRAPKTQVNRRTIGAARRTTIR